MTSRIMPPRENRFKKWQSGNPAGRPKKFEKEALPLIIALSNLLIRVYQKDKTAAQTLAAVKKILLENKKDKQTGGKND